VKSLFRLITLGLIVTGWTLACASIHLIVTPGRITLLPKDRLGFQDTYVDARNWTPTELRQHPDVVARLVHLDRSDVLTFAVENKKWNIESQLTYAVEHPLAAPPTSPLVLEKAKDQFDVATKSVRSIFD
jgi:hypothetical protein